MDAATQTLTSHRLKDDISAGPCALIAVVVATTLDNALKRDYGWPTT